MRNINLFPLSIIKEKISLNKDEKNKMIGEIDLMISQSEKKGYRGKESSWTGDTQGFEYLFKNKKFYPLLTEIKKLLLIYINHLGIDKSKIDLYMTRSWATVSTGKERISKHKHKQSHISFAYYLKKNENDSNIVFFDENYQNEIIPGLFESSTIKNRGIIKNLNLANAVSIDIKVDEDDIIIFPSKALHGTQADKSNNQRISISGDVICVAKNSNLLETMMPPIGNWNII
jgi:uncharacterized protein (TIGR02466 family)